MDRYKFRAWDDANKRMLYRGLHDRNWYSTPSNDKDGCHCVGPVSPKDEKTLEIMQYTGLKDKNGVDDYAGNIWEVEYDGKKYRYVREVECEWEGYKFDFTNIDHNLSPVHSNVSELGEIVGTIHDKEQQLTE